MAAQILGAEELRSLFSYDADTGEFTRLVTKQKRATVSGKIGSDDLYGYKTTRIAGRSYKIHRLAWLYVHGAWPDGDIDHINGNRSDNRIANLRDVARKVNLENQRRATNNRSTGLLGAYFDRRKKNCYYARISVGDKSIHLGTFQTAEAAHEAYLKAKRELHAGCTI
jgi:hypothetical protein